jgi:hypothetical protein|tara:strand:- start:19 stop:345 length:327 start_codon:yes stop_codon:yes gene_type:complete
MLLSTVSLLGQKKIELDNPVGSTSTSFRVGDVHFSAIRKTIEVSLYETNSDGEFVVDGDRINCIWTEADEAVEKTAELWGDALTESIFIELAQDHECLGAGTVSAISE